MNVTYDKKKAMTFIGYHTEISPDEGYVKCPEFWEKEYNQKYARLWQTMKPETPIEEAILSNHIGWYLGTGSGEIKNGKKCVQRGFV